MGYHGDSLARLGATGPFQAACRRTTQRVGELLHTRAKENTPVAKPPPGHESEWLQARHGRLPGTLKESWRLGEVMVTDDGRRYMIDVYTHDDIAAFVEYPTLPHLIVSHRPGGLLRFWDKFGRTIYAVIVHHTGTKGSFMLATAVAEVGQLWQAIGDEELQRWAHEQAAAVMA